MNEQEAGNWLRVKPGASPQEVQKAFVASVGVIGRKLKTTNSPEDQEELKFALRKCIEAKQFLLPNEEVVPEALRKKINEAKAKKAKAGADNQVQSDSNQQVTANDMSSLLAERARRTTGKKEERRRSSEQNTGSDQDDAASEHRAVKDEPQEEQESISLQAQVPEESEQFNEDEQEAESTMEMGGRSDEADEGSIGEAGKDETTDASEEAAEATNGVRRENRRSDQVGTPVGAVTAIAFKQLPKWVTTVVSVFVSFVVLGVLFIGVSEDERGPTEENPYAEDIVVLKQLIQEQRQANQKISEDLTNRMAGLAKKRTSLARNELQVVRELYAIFSGQWFSPQAEQKRQKQYQVGLQALKDEEWQKAYKQFRLLEHGYRMQLQHYEQLEVVVKERLAASEVRSKWRESYARKRLVDYPLGENTEKAWRSVESRFNSRHFDGLVQDYEKLEEDYNHLVKRSKTLLPVYEKMVEYETEWLRASGRDFNNTYEFQQLKNMTATAYEALNNGNMSAAEEQMHQLLPLYETAIGSLKKAVALKNKLNELREKMAAQSVEDEVGINRMLEARNLYNLGINALQSGEWKSAVKSLESSKALYQQELVVRGVIENKSQNASRKRSAEQRANINRAYPHMIFIKGGRFRMGDISGEGDTDELPVRLVNVPSFRISQFEVTFAQYDRFARETGNPKPEDEGWGRGSMPVINVSWQDARKYARWLSSKLGGNYRLPTEAEWEYVARAGTSTRYYWGDKIQPQKANCRECGNQWDGRQATFVGSFAPNAFKIYDILGNVSEWVQDCWNGDYTGAPTNGRAQSTGYCDQRVVRGGSWDDDPELLRSSSRFSSRLDNRVSYRGFRVVQQ